MRPNPRQAFARIVPACIAVLAAIALAACGSSTSNSNGGTATGSNGGTATGGSGGAKPAYCSTLSSLQTTVHDLTHLSASGGVTGLTAQLTKIKSDATTLVNQAKGDFPAETSGLQSSVSKFETAVKSMSSSPSAAQIGSVASAAVSVINAVKTFADSTTAKCG